MDPSAADPLSLSKIDPLLTEDPAVEQARNRHILACVEKKGHRWTPPPLAARQTVRGLLAPRPLSVSDARARGYAWPAGAGEAGAPREDPKVGELVHGSMESGWASGEWLGVSLQKANGGCEAESLSAFYGSVSDGIVATSVPPGALGPTVHQVLEDEGVKEIRADWAACMKKSGETRYGAPEALQSEMEMGRKNDRELAVKDATCRESVKFEPRMEKLLAQYLTPLLQKREADFQALREIRERGNKRAQER
ncbi:hypothetical protein [Falsarthrobacter nasiphocae]|uniref:Uncharacterized protein n=1 Tax=Falsarthrobacter nasiphocae TaxID=189863 RepID=A0AAE3YFB5_9MICC|nr:hypothetical protein [Falsarthrobacter nasiphocae]MDR6892200.1 hypothetical protein [Falsarthrobacter nasiphocae]